MSDYQTADDRDVISESEAASLQQDGVLAPDPNRALPLWFDGRFLTARDLNRQQNYFLARHNTLGRSVGHGVIEGLDVALDDGGGTLAQLKIAPGQGLAFDGAHIHLPVEMVLNLSDLSVQNALNARMGLSVHPSAPLHSRSGLFVLSLRAVEYTANQTTSFPTHATGERTVHMGDRIEAVAATLTPYAPMDTARDSIDARSSAAHRIFQNGKLTGVPTYALPLAMMSIRHGVIEWIDVHMVRRDLVASRRDFLGLGLGEDQLRLAHFNQYRTALRDVMSTYAANNQPSKFPAEQHFKILPAAGPMPADAVDPGGLAQVFFPGEVDVELSIIPDDELPALIEESFELPPIDLTPPVSDRDSLSVMIVAPMPRHALRSQLKSLGALTKPLRPLSMLGQGPQKPLERLGAMKISLADAAARAGTVDSAAAQEWAGIVSTLTNFGLDGDSSQRTLWYMRRRTLRRSADLESVLVAVNNLDLEDDTVVPNPDGPVVEPDPDPTPDPTPEPDPLPDNARAALIRLAGFGDLARIVETQFRRVRPGVTEVFADAVLNTPIADDPVSVTALVARMTDANVNATAALKADVETILTSNAKGRGLLSVALIGSGTNKVSAERFKELMIFVVPDKLIESVADDLVKLKDETQRELLPELAAMIKAQDEDSIKALTQKIAEIAAEADRPAPSPSPSRPDPVVDATAEREAAAKRKAEALVKSLPQKADQTRLSKALDKATAVQRDTIVNAMTSAKVASSQIVTTAALNALSTGGTITTNQLRVVRALDVRVVGGINIVEPALLKVTQSPAAPTRGRTQPAATTGRGAAVGGVRLNPALAASPALGRGGATPFQPIVGLDRSALLLATGTTVANKRIGLIAGASNLRQLAAFATKHRRAAAKLKNVVADIIKATDAAGANVRNVATAIAKTMERNG